MAVYRWVHLIFAGLSEKERTVVFMRNGVLTGAQMTLEEVGKKLKLTRERIRQIEAKAQETIDINVSLLKDK